MKLSKKDQRAVAEAAADYCAGDAAHRASWRRKAAEVEREMRDVLAHPGKYVRPRPARARVALAKAVAFRAAIRRAPRCRRR